MMDDLVRMLISIHEKVFKVSFNKKLVQKFYLQPKPIIRTQESDKRPSEN